MQAFVDSGVGNSNFSFSRFRRLLTHMIDAGFFINQYDRTATFTAAETFTARKGNCLAYTNLFVALARAADLDASYQVVDGPPVWDAESGFLVRNNHINVRVDGVRFPGLDPGELTVDFNSVEADPLAFTRKVTDSYAASLFYANVAIEHLHAKDYRQTFGYLKRAVLTEPNNIDVWNNLGALYSILDKVEFAEQAYRLAMQIDPTDKTAVSGLAKSLAKQGREEEAEKYTRLATRYQNRNPYYHFALAQQALHNDAFNEALDAINQAIQLKRDNPRFYALRAAAAQELGDEALVAASERLQRKHSKSARAELSSRRFYN